MGSWVELYESTKKQLGRELLQNEIDFIKWLYKKHETEINAEK